MLGQASNAITANGRRSATCNRLLIRENDEERDTGRRKYRGPKRQRKKSEESKNKITQETMERKKGKRERKREKEKQSRKKTRY